MKKENLQNRINDTRSSKITEERVLNKIRNLSVAEYLASLSLLDNIPIECSLNHKQNIEDASQIFPIPVMKYFFNSIHLDEEEQDIYSELYYHFLILPFINIKTKEKEDINHVL